MNVKQYRKKPVVIEAMHPIGYTEFKAVEEWAAESGVVVIAMQENTGPAFLLIKTLEGTMRAEVGDYIIKGVKGEFYPCKPDIFEATYEPVDAPDTGSTTSDSANTGPRKPEASKETL